jgi:hypothetical protein
MDRLTAFVAIHHLKLRLDIAARHPELLEGIEMTPKLQGLASAMAKLQHGLEDRSGKLLARIETADTRSGAAFDKANSSLDETEKSMADVEAFIASLEGSNGGPTLSGSSDTPGQSPPDVTVNALGGPRVL